MNDSPVFAVVGHPNKGKSSIVATLAHHDGIAISAISGTTTRAQSYPFIVDGQQLYELVDTPGFQRPRQVLDWVQSTAENASERKQAVKDFLDEYREQTEQTVRFRDEVELLTPILQGAGIIYVVDGSVPYSAEYEAEMTVLQWTGQPRMALINPIGGEAYVAEWQQALGQFFSIVKVFDPMTADIEKQLAVLSSFAELNLQWQPALHNAIELMRKQTQRSHIQAAYLIAEAISDLLSYREQMPLLDDSTRSATQTTLKHQYQTILRSREQALRKSITELYAHPQLKCQQQPLTTQYPDLFDQDHWYLFGLSRQKLVALATGAGAAAGAALDTVTAGATLLAGALVGGVLSGAASLFISQNPERISIKGLPLGGQQLTAGPVKNLEFAFVLLGRAVQHWQSVAHRTHANQQQLVLKQDQPEHWIDRLDKTQQIRLSRLLQQAAQGLGQSELEKLQGLLGRML